MWLRGIWVGVDPHAEETLIGTPEGIITAHSVRRLLSLKDGAKKMY